MKKLVKSALALATILFASACMQENHEPVQTGSTVTFTVEVPEAVATKAIGDGTNINNLVYAVYKTSAEDLDAAKISMESNMPVYQVSEATAFVGGKTNVTLELINDQNYIVLFWAQVDQTWVGENSDLTNITYPSDLVANNDKYSAFSGVAFVEKVDGARTERVTLTRPFAQINIAAADPVRYDVDVTTSKVKVFNAASSFNVATQSASGNTDVEYGAATNPEGSFNGYEHYVAMNYVFANGTVSVAYEINTDKHGTVSNYDAPINNVPVEKNYRTNIVGNLLTSNVDYTVELDNTWGDPANEVTVVSNALELQEAIDESTESAEITLDGDINLSDLFEALTKSSTEKASFVTVPAGKEIVLNLNGYSITGVDETEKNFGLIQNNGKLTVKNTSETVSKMSLVANHDNDWDRYSAVISNNPGAELTVEGNVVVEHLGGTDMSYGIDALTNGGSGAVKTTIDGATVTSTYRAVRQFLNSDSTMNELLIKDGSTLDAPNKGVFFHDPSTKANLGKLTIEDGASVGTVYLYVTEGSTEWPVEVSIAASSVSEGGVTYANNPKGYAVEEVNGIWTVVVDPVAKVGDAEFASLEEAAAAAKAGDTITVLRDATLSAELTLPANVTLNGNGKQIDGTIYAGGNLTFVGHTKVTSFSASYYDRVITIGEGACLEITGTGRVTLGYGNTFNITGSIENAKSADKTNVQPSLIIPGGMSITGGSNATMNVINAYVQIGSTTSKNSAANGVFTLNFTNSIAEFTNQLTFAEPTSGKTPTFNVNIVNSVLTTATKFVAAAPKCNVKVDNSNVTIATYFRNSGKYEVVNGSVLTGSTIQFGENGGNDGALTVDASEVTINASSTGHALDGKGTGSITLTNGAKATVTYYKDMKEVNVDATSEFTGTQVQ